MPLPVMLGQNDITTFKKKTNAKLCGQMSAQLSKEKESDLVGHFRDHTSNCRIMSGLKHGTVERVLGRCFGQPLDG